MNIVLCALNAGLASAFDEAFHDVDTVRVHHGDILQVSADAIVSPANSFGYMDGSLDLVLSLHFGWHVEERVRAHLLEHHMGELPVGQAFIVPTDNERVPWLVSAPTMRVPMNVADTANAFLAFRAILVAVQRHNAVFPHAAIHSVACPGLGTGCGAMPAERCAMQMRYAWSVVMEGHRERMGGLAGAVRSHMALVGAE